jgi:anti-sigma B factor antagonist
MALAMTSRSVSDAVVLDLTGKLCVLEHTLRERIKAFLEEGRRHFVLNLAAVTYIDSDGLGELISIWTSIRKVNGRLALLHPAQRVQDLFRITKLDTLFEIFDDESQAVGVAQHEVTQV